MTNTDTNRRRRRRNGVIAAASGVALLLGGFTYALWSDTASINGGSITAGDLELTSSQSEPWDISADRTDTYPVKPANTLVELEGVKGHEITKTDEWLAVPGDTVGIILPYTVKLKGDNLVAQLALDTTTFMTNNDIKNMTVTYEVYNEAGKLISPAKVTPVGKTTIAYFQASNVGQAAGTPDGSIPMVSGTTDKATVYVLLRCDFDKNTGNRVDHGEVMELNSAITAELTQVRNNVPVTGATTPQGNFNK